MAKRSAGILLFRRQDVGLEVLLVHPGGPFWRTKDDGAWSIPKGEFDASEEPLAAALREFHEELGTTPEGRPVALRPIKQKGGKTVLAWALEGDLDCSAIESNMFEMEWPPRSGTRASFPEVDRAAWFDLETALRKINAAQAAFIQELEERIDSSATSDAP